MSASDKDVVEKVSSLGFVWDTIDPFLFCVHHDDDYPAGDERMAPPRSLLVGRNIGSDFVVKDGFRMYHGDVVPGFPRHPHRGFETVTLVRKGYIDHSDSLGAAARFGEGGDCQWMTAGRGVEHSEMFPLRDSSARNPLELFQIWLNLPAASKFVPPHFAMLWGEKVPKHVFTDGEGRRTTVVTVAGALDASTPPPPPPPHSWASQPDSHVAIWTIKMEPSARWTVPAASADANRVLYFHVGESMTVGGRKVSAPCLVRVRPGVPVELGNGAVEGELLMLQGKPIGEPVAQQGPFVMNTMNEIRDAFMEYRSGAFGKWPWDSDGPVHAREKGRFAIHADGREEHM